MFESYFESGIQKLIPPCDRVVWQIKHAGVFNLPSKAIAVWFSSRKPHCIQER